MYMYYVFDIFILFSSMTTNVFPVRYFSSFMLITFDTMHRSVSIHNKSSVMP